VKTFDEIIGNDAIKGYLTHMVDKGAVGNSWLFSGIAGVGKGLFAEALANRLLDYPERQNHPDLTIIRPQGKLGMHSIEAIRNLGVEAQQAPFEAPAKVFIIHDAEKMLPTSANALLKTFEEPATTTVIILLSSVPEQLLPTILSRCRKIAFQPVPQEEIEAFLKAQDKEPSFAALSRGSPARALRLADRGTDEKRELLLKVLSFGRFKDFGQLQSVVTKLSADIDEQKKATEAALQEQHITSDLTATQKATLMKEIDGAVAAQYLEEVDALFDIILSWYRDLTLLHVDGNKSQLFNRDAMPALEQALQSGTTLSLDTVQETLASIRLAIARSLPLSQCLESLFLRLNFL